MKIITAFLVAPMSLLALAANAETPSSHQPPSSVLEFVRAVERAEPVSQAWLTSVLTGQLTCTPTEIPFGDKVKHRLDCDAYNVKLGPGLVEHINFRTVDAGSLLILSGLKNECVPVGKLIAPTDPVVDGCTDGVSCPYVTKQRSWGTMSVAVRTEADASQCATRVVFKSGL